MDIRDELVFGHYADQLLLRALRYRKLVKMGAPPILLAKEQWLLHDSVIRSVDLTNKYSGKVFDNASRDDREGTLLDRMNLFCESDLKDPFINSKTEEEILESTGEYNENIKEYIEELFSTEYKNKSPQ